MSDPDIFDAEGVRQLFDATYLANWLADPVRTHLELDRGWRRKVRDPRWAWGHLRQRWEQAARAARRAGIARDDFMHAELADIQANDPNWADLRAADDAGHRYVQTCESFVLVAVEWTDWAWDSLPAEPGRTAYEELKFVVAVADSWVAGSFDGIVRDELDEGWVLEEYKSTSASSAWKLDQYQNGIQGRTYEWAAWNGFPLELSPHGIQWLVWEVGTRGRGEEKEVYPVFRPVYRPIRGWAVRAWRSWLEWHVLAVRRWLAFAANSYSTELAHALNPAGTWDFLTKLPPSEWTNWLEDPENGFERGPAWDPLRRNG